MTPDQALALIPQLRQEVARLADDLLVQQRATDEAEATLDRVRALCEQAEPRHDQYEFAQAVITAIDGSET